MSVPTDLSLMRRRREQQPPGYLAQYLGSRRIQRAREFALLQRDRALHEAEKAETLREHLACGCNAERWAELLRILEET